MKRSDFKIGFSQFTYMILHTTKQRTPVPTGVQTVDKDLGISPRIFLLKRLKVSIFKTFKTLFGIMKISKKAVFSYDDSRN